MHFARGVPQPGHFNWKPQSGRAHRQQRIRCRSSSAATAAPTQPPLSVSSFLNAGLISGSLSLAGDVLAQLLANRSKPGTGYDVARAGRMFSFGLVFYGPYQLVWYRALDKRFPGRALANFIAKVALNQLVLAPVVISAVFAWNLGLQGKLAGWPDKARQDFTPTLLTGWKFWVPAASVNFAAVPLKYQVLYMSCCGIIWTAILSASSAHKQQLAVSNAR